MKPHRALTRLIESARRATPPDAPEEGPLPPGAATRIAARWIAARPGIAPVVLWERLSYAGLAVALLAGGASVFLHQPPPPQESASAEVMPDLFSATITDSPEG